MSDHVKWALEFDADLTSGERLTLTVFARAANEDGVMWWGPQKLMAHTHMKIAGLRKCVAALCEVGALTRMRRTRKDGSEGSAFTVLNIPRDTPLDLDQYEFVIGEIIDGHAIQGLRTTGGIPEDTGSPQHTGDRIPEDTGDGSTTRKEKRTTSSKAIKTVESQEKALADGTLSIQHNRRPVPFKQAALGARLLDAYNSETGQRKGKFRHNGAPSDGYLRILSAVLDHPEVEESEWLRMLHTVLAWPYMEWGSVSVGVVFGPGVVEENLANPARGRAFQEAKRRKGGSVINGSLKERNANLKDDIRRMESLDTG